jgi:hypothetical protein
MEEALNEGQDTSAAELPIKLEIFCLGEVGKNLVEYC